jgi:GNAT superfamily N-acetyltransferase
LDRDVEQAAKFQRQFVLSEIRIIMAEGEEVGYLQIAELPDAFLLKELHISAPFQNLGIGSLILRRLFAEAQQIGKPITVGVVKFNPALRLYQRHGFKAWRGALAA